MPTFGKITLSDGEILCFVRLLCENPLIFQNDRECNRTEKKAKIKMIEGLIKDFGNSKVNNIKAVKNLVKLLRFHYKRSCQRGKKLNNYLMELHPFLGEPSNDAQDMVSNINIFSILPTRKIKINASVVLLFIIT